MIESKQKYYVPIEIIDPATKINFGIDGDKWCEDSYEFSTFLTDSPNNDLSDDEGVKSEDEYKDTGIIEKTFRMKEDTHFSCRNSQ